MCYLLLKLRCLAHKRYKTKKSFSLWNNPLFEDPTNRTSNNLLFEAASEDFDNQSRSIPVTNKESTSNPFDSLTHTKNGHAIHETTLYPVDLNLPSKNVVQGVKKKNATGSVLMNHETRRFETPHINFLRAPSLSDLSVRLYVMSFWSPRALFKTTVYFAFSGIVKKNSSLNSALEFGCCLNIYVETSCLQGWCLGHNEECHCHLIVHKRTVELVFLMAVGLLPENDLRTKAFICVEMDVLCFKPKCTMTRIKVDYLSTFKAAELSEIINTEIIEQCHVPLSTGFTSQTSNDENIILISESKTNDSRLQEKVIVNLQEASLTEEDTNSKVFGASELDKVTTQGYYVSSYKIRTKAHAFGKRKQEPSQEESEEDDNEHDLLFDYQ